MTRRCAAALGLLILLAAPPTVMTVLLGNPLPDWSAIAAGDFGGDTLPRILACIAWLGWAQLALGILLEAAAARRGRTAPHITLGQGLARALILTIMTASIAGPLLGTAVTARAAPLDNPPPPARTASATVPAVSGHASANASALAPTQRPAASHHPGYLVGSEHDVAPRLWDIAEQHLGDPLRWREIRDLNLGYTMNDGRVFDAEQIRLGWHLLMPADATGLSAATTAKPPTAGGGGAEAKADSADQRPATVTVTRGENLTEIAHEVHVPVQEMWEANRGHAQPGGRTFTDPNLIYPHQKLVVPPTGHAAAPHTDSPAQHPDHKPGSQPPVRNAPAPTTTSSPGTPPAATPSTTRPAAPPAAAHSAPATQQHGATDKASSSLTSTLLPAALATFGGAGCLLAAGIVLRLRRGRGRQQRHRGYRRLIPVPHGAQADIEFAAATAADPVDVEWLDEGLRVLGCALATSPDIELPNIVAVYLRSECLELVLTAPAPAAPAPFCTGQNGTLWTLTKAAAAAADLPTAAVLPPVPALATVGLTRDQDGRPERLVLLDVEGIGSISVAGEPSHAADLLRFMAGDLAYNGWSVGVQVIACGMGDDLSSLAPDRIRCVSDIAALREHLLADQVFRPVGNPLAERVHNEYGDAWLTPRVVLLAGCESDDDVAAISDLLADLHAAGRSLLGVVIAGDHPDAHWHARLDHDGRLHLPNLGDLVVEAQTLPADLVAGVGETIQRAESEADTPAPPSTLSAPWAQGTDIVGGLLPAPVAAGAADDADQEDVGQEPVDLAEVDEARAVLGDQLDTNQTLAEARDVSLPGAATDGSTDRADEPAPGQAVSGEGVRSLRPELDEARRFLATREALDPSLDEDLARFLDPPAYQATAGILGRITVTAAGTPVPSKIASLAQAVEFLLCLVLSNNGKTGAEVADELFSEVRRKTVPRVGEGRSHGEDTTCTRSDGVRRDQIRKIMAALREWLGVDADGKPYLPSATSVKPPRYLITNSLLLDWHLFMRLRARAQARAAAEYTEAAVADYRAALSLVRGRPFDARRVEGYRWLVYRGGVEHHVLSAVVDTAHELALLGMNTGDGDLVEFAAAAAMRADPYGALNQPYADRLRWQMMLGNKDRFSEIVRELIEVRSQNSEQEICDLDIDGEPGKLINEFLGREGLRVLGS